MKNSTNEPPGRPNLRIARRSNVLPLEKTSIAPAKTALIAEFPSTPVYRSVDDMVHDMRPDMPVHCLRPATIASTAKRFLKAFPGDVMFAVKTNPDPRVLRYLARVGVKHFDVASLAEVKLVADTLSDVQMYFMHPVKSREAIKGAYFGYRRARLLARLDGRAC